ncbi:MAG: exonuclease SbcCD subunit D C-terminal domain-containing protein [Candidatus Cloacimonetes bacterium]|nr:exonuclease SbcCD subunit D C-terminal domain-containing protein [Candidatus Cloacimonadota bacterium]
MKLLHTADLHLGQHLMFADRKQEHQSFLNWLRDLIINEEINLLIIAGDIFDTGTPPNYALQMYYRFLMEISQIESCRDVVVIGGNHDSVSTLNAPRDILSVLNVHVIGGITENPEDEIIITKDDNGNPTAIICAVPFLNDRDVRKSIAGESYSEKSQKLMDGIKEHYNLIKEQALTIRSKKNLKVPIIATGHLFTVGGSTSEGIRDIYVGSLSYFPVTSFPEEFDYIALGHLHKPQIVGNNSKIRYSGSPIPLSFGEISHPKQVIIYDCSNQEISEIEIPVSRILKQIKGSLTEIEEQIAELIKIQKEIWLEIHIIEDEYKGDLSSTISTFVENSELKIFRIIDVKGNFRKQLMGTEEIIPLSEISVIDVFKKRLEAEQSEFDEETKSELFQMFNETLNEIYGEKGEN